MLQLVIFSMHYLSRNNIFMLSQNVCFKVSFVSKTKTNRHKKLLFMCYNDKNKAYACFQKIVGE